MDMDTSSISSASDLSDPPSSNPPSSPLSVLSRSPSISPRTSLSYNTSRLPSPPSTITSPGSASPMKSSDQVSVENEITVNPDGPPPAKRRRVERKPRTTEYLDLKAASQQSEKDEKLLEQLTGALRKKKKIVVIAGAGMSVSAGIPDFRSSKGLFATLPKEHGLKGSGKHLFDASVYKHDSTTSSFHTMVRDLSHLTRNAKPTRFHHLIASLAKEGRLLRLYTQNVDGLDTSMPPLSTTVPLNTKGPWPKTIQLHGGLGKMVCSKCSEISDFDDSLFEGPEAPLCKGCEETDNVRTSHAGKRSHGIGRLRPRMVLYNEYNPDEESIANVVRADIRARPDAIIVVGTSMKIPGVRNMVKDMCRVTRERKDGVTAWINLDPEPTGADLKNCWDLVVKGKCDDVASLVHLPRYDASVDEAVVIDEKMYEDTVRGVKLEVEIRKTEGISVKKESRDSSPLEAKPQLADNVQGMPTPSASPKARAALPTIKIKTQPKQSKLAFSGLNSSNSSTNTTTGRKDAKKATQRKPKQSKKAEPKPPKATISKTFKATKATTAAPSKIPAKREFELEPEPVLSPRSVMREEFSLRPRSKAAGDDTVPQKGIEIAPPTTPPQQPARLSLAGTISPTSKPRGFASLID
ncbi:DHS-like NAD/FAD-binding domain-containing protein [Annulohypoxylon maeteangense]|uniref:DHS-like NAD/FAD-binding domain-containing protein n=1 Tax=Annulohypoxylon maeteangense TaxID=1927788 RepID=UPI00200870A2|nr:DHS-like NAD/FAD-binding domain-containing protein [Annulohypoxylon maeteangense]KAI0889257.1 DHS-like NAD/FAD-binding domain-containing protein [Annulohypoxylon maeteangense]